MTTVRHCRGAGGSVANRVRLLDNAYVGADGHSVTDTFEDYARRCSVPIPFRRTVAFE